MRRLLFLFLLLAAPALYAQSNLVSPVTITPLPGASPTMTITFVPATPTFPCPTGATPASWVMCGQNGAITVDFGDGLGYQSLKGKDGADGTNGAPGPQGAPGSQGPQGAQGIQGPTGPAGAQGPTGPAGPQGKQGPAGSSGSMPSTITCGFSLKNGKITLTGCK